MPRLSTFRGPAAVIGLAVMASLAPAAEPRFPADQTAFFERHVLPVLQTHCFKCHGGDKVRGGLRLNTRAGVLKGGDAGPAVDLQNPDVSRLLQAVRHENDLKMPPNSRLSPQEIDVLGRWVKMKLPWKRGDAVVSAPAPSDYWAYRPVKRPDVPPPPIPPLAKGGIQGGWVRNPIDAFIRAGLERKGLSPAPPADRVALARRVYYDLTGLPPAPEEVDAFVNDRSAEAYEHLIDRLLASPDYGEKWGRHWLDLVRYAETNGYERDGPKPYAWRYRDYVIRSFNADKPYDRFIKEQLAGDELDRRDPDCVTATGYYRLGLFDDEPVDPDQTRYDELDDWVATTSQVFLAMTMNCARCHDHKIDPLPQKDYYQLVAFFQDVEHFSKDRKVESKYNLTDISPPRTWWPRQLALSVNHCLVQPPQTHVLMRGNPHAPGAAVEPAFPAVLGAPLPVIPPPGKDARSSGRRIALANWIASPENPLSARVMVNRIWQHHFGRGIVASTNDFGKFGTPPTHPELLDWLADEFVRGGWRIKRLHKLIMMSNTYRMSAQASEAGLRLDPANASYWRFAMRRLTAEEVRDSMLAVAGRLNRKPGGPSVCPPLPPEVLAGQSIPGDGWPKSPPDESVRRSVYVKVKRSLLVPILATHDQADTDSSCPVRYTTTVPTQALGLLNGEFSREQAAALAERLQSEAPNDLAAQVRRAIRLTTARSPGEDEVRRDLDFVRNVQTRDKLGEFGALTSYCLLLLNANEFFYLD